MAETRDNGYVYDRLLKKKINSDIGLSVVACPERIYRPIAYLLFIA